MTPDERFIYYIGGWTHPTTIVVPENVKHFGQNELYFYRGPSHTDISGFPYQYATLTPGFWWGGGQATVGLLDISCLTISADGINNRGLPALVKVRVLGDPLAGILCPLAYIRHWGHIKTVRKCDVAWAPKKNTCVWRGVPTGDQDASNITKSTNKRILFCQKYYDLYDVGITQTWNRWPDSYVKEPMSIAAMLEYKYIISIPGNDKDSGINWKLASNSVVIMAPPEVESWLMEGLLKPYVHYVPLAADYSDLPHILEWCTTHEEDCLRIVAAANEFMSQFNDIEVEKQIFANIKAHYAKSFVFV